MNDLKTNPDPLVSGRIINILIVDDRSENLLTLESIIEGEGRKIIRATGGNEALRIAIREDIGLVMMDIQMPEIDGIEVTRLLRSNSRTKHIPVIFVSAVSGAEKPALGEFESGTVDSLSKPLNIEETRNKVAMAEIMYHLRMDRADALDAANTVTRGHDSFVAKIGHDLKSPMRAIINLANWLADDLSKDANPNVRENLSLLSNRVSRLNGMLDAILEYDTCSKPPALEEQVDLQHMVHLVFESLAPPPGFRIEANKLPSVVAEQARIYKVLHNLLSNSITHHHNPAEGMIRVSCEFADTHIVVRISDNGPGIKPQQANGIFELFGSKPGIEESAGRGAGLAISKRLLQGMGQHIWLEPESHDGGASFCFTISRHDS